MQPPDDNPFRPLLWTLAASIALSALVLFLTACAAPAPTAAPAGAKPAFPADMRVVCYQGAYYIASVSADQVVRLPLTCT